MTVQELADRLRETASVPDGTKVVRIHLFGIKYAKELENVSIAEVVARAEINEPYKTEIAKGRNLAPYVKLLDENIIP